MTTHDNKLTAHLPDWSHISPGVRAIVAELNERGWVTTDSGDGTNYKKGMECALPYRHVFGRVPEEHGMWVNVIAHRLQRWYPKARVEISYSPGEPLLFMLFPDGKPES